MDSGKANDQHGRLAVTLTEVELRELIRQEVVAVVTNQFGTPSKPTKPYLTVNEAAEFACIAPSTVRLYIRKRQLRAQRVGRRVIIAAPDLESFLSRNPIAVAAH